MCRKWGEEVLYGIHNYMGWDESPIYLVLYRGNDSIRWWCGGLKRISIGGGVWRWLLLDGRQSINVIVSDHIS